MKKLFFTTIIAMLIVVPSAHAAEPAQPLRSGMYEGLVLAVSSTGRVAGHFNMAQGDNPTKRCEFDFAGQINGDGALIQMTGSAGLSGRITASAAEEVTLSMPQVRRLPGCGLVLPPEVEASGGIGLDRIRSGSWIDLAKVQRARVALKPTPDGAAGRTYVIRGDVVGILTRKENLVQVIYPSERDHWAQGWVSAADLAPIAPD